MNHTHYRKLWKSDYSKMVIVRKYSPYKEMAIHKTMGERRRMRLNAQAYAKARWGVELEATVRR